jgi:hypothetical protein
MTCLHYWTIDASAVLIRKILRLTAAILRAARSIQFALPQTPV